MKSHRRLRVPHPQPMHPALLPLVLLASILILVAPVSAQTPPAADSPAPEAEEQLAPETESAPTPCPCCGGATRQDKGQGAGPGHCHKGRGQGTGQARGQGGRGRGPHGSGQPGQRLGSGRPDARVAHFLIDNHEKLDRTVEIVPGGVRTRTVSEDPEIVEALRTHVQQMADLLEGGGRIRNWDPLFREIFDHRDDIQMKIVEIEGGVEVVETSADEEVAALIRSHAGKVEDFVARGIEAYREETALPESEASSTTP